MTRQIIFIAIFLHLTILTTASSPAPSPSPTPSLGSSRRPQPQILSNGRGGLPSASPAPTGSVGRFLGTSGLESPAFVQRCQKCCRQSQRRLKRTFQFLKSCTACRVNRNLNPPSRGPCRQGAPLGFANAPSDCFFDRCYRMLVSAGPCICVR